MAEKKTFHFGVALSRLRRTVRIFSIFTSCLTIMMYYSRPSKMELEFGCYMLKSQLVDSDWVTLRWENPVHDDDATPTGGEKLFENFKIPVSNVVGLISLTYKFNVNYT